MTTQKKQHTGISRRRFLQGTGGLLGAAAIPGFLRSPPAYAGGELRMLTWNGHAEPDIVADFERKHGIRIQAQYYTGGDEMLALIAQSPPGSYDLVLSDGEYVEQLIDADYIVPLDPEDYHFDDYFPEFQHFPGHWSDDTLYSVMVRFGFLGVSYRTDHISESEARSYRLFWNDNLSGRVGHFDWHLPNLGQMSLLNGNDKPYDLSAAQWAEVQETTMSLRPHVAGFFDYGGTFSSLRTGQIHAMCGIGDWITGVLARDGAPVNTVVPEEGGLQWTESFSVARGARNPELAHEFIRYITSPEGQIKSAQMNAYPAIVPNRRAWTLLNEVNPDEAKRQGMVLEGTSAIDHIREGRIQNRQQPVRQSLGEWNDFWSDYKSA